MIHPPDCTHDDFLYLATSNAIIGMVLAQENNGGHEHAIYYLSKSLTSPKLNYKHIEKLALASVLVVQRFRHYILLRKTTIIVDSNPMYHI